MALVDGRAMASGSCISLRDTVDRVMAARTKSKVTPKYKTKYRVKNWPTYEGALRKRGNVTVWFDEDAIDGWNAVASGRPGGQREYSEVAILTALTLRSVFHLGLRQTEGFVDSLFRLMDLELKAPCSASLKQPGRLDIPSLRSTKPYLTSQHPRRETFLASTS